ncbi:hypothetical protein [Roseovarius rhodophyticola]|uniref:VOC domain-containing protein n=1 Tax=Roseovarius rhodophyticola TaxID=3080827 RepID=A0ABZ2TIW6_9RHOB|nr:hypothetical protein [Roseovarius sp. W115]MDV2929907.1 hypothetical protein [Roseovarius sp. W115]
MGETSIMQDGFDTRPIEMLPMWQIAFLAPDEDVDRIFDAVADVAPLTYGATDRNGYRMMGGVEYYRPTDDAPTGSDGPRQRPGVDQMRIFIPRDMDLLNAVIEAIYDVHSYYEPPITMTEVLRSQTKGLDDSQNPHRWWNKDGDWKSS